MFENSMPFLFKKKAYPRIPETTMPTLLNPYINNTWQFAADQIAMPLSQAQLLPRNNPQASPNNIDAIKMRGIVLPMYKFMRSFMQLNSKLFFVFSATRLLKAGTVIFTIGSIKNALPARLILK